MTIWNMSTFDLVITSSLIPCTGLLLLLILIHANPLFNRRQNTLYVFAVVTNLLMIAVVAADFMLSASMAENAWIWRRITSFLNFACSPFIPLLLYEIFNKEKDGILIYLPAAINIVLCFLSIFFRLVFYISRQNSYGRGPLFLLPFLVSLLYIAIIFFKPAKYQLQSKRTERVVLMFIVGMLILSICLEITAKLRLLVWNSSAIGFILYYLLLNIHNFILDPLTGVYNRILYSRDLSSLNGTTSCLIALIDINNFKFINDNYGHEEGDRCLIKFAGILNHCFQNCATLYRIGGDEFVLIAKGAQHDKFQECLMQARTEAMQSDIQFACGLVSYDGKGNMDDALHEVDQNMYKNKSDIKRG